MANKKPDPAPTGDAQDKPAAPLPAMPDPIFAQDKDGRDRPMSGGSFTRQSDGTLTRNLEA